MGRLYSPAIWAGNLRFAPLLARPTIRLGTPAVHLLICSPRDENDRRRRRNTPACSTADTEGGHDDDRPSDAASRSHPLDDPARHGGSAGNRTRRVRIPLVRGGIHPLPAATQLHRHGGRARRARRRLHDLRAAQNAAAHFEFRRGVRRPPPRHRPADDRKARSASSPASAARGFRWKSAKPTWPPRSSSAPAASRPRACSTSSTTTRRKTPT